MPDHPAIRVYLDANVLYSASLNENSDFLRFWRMHGIATITSPYAIGEVTRNLLFSGHRERFNDLLRMTEIANDGEVGLVPPHIVLVAKDRPILAAAISSNAAYLVTGDKNHFGHLYKTTISAVHVISPVNFLAIYKGRLVS